jgi:nucleotide-binding universal stress UspA family protein
MKQLIVATDGSEGSSAAVDQALTLALQLGASVTFVYVRRPPSAVLGHPYYDHRLSSGLEEARATLADALESARSRGVAAESEILEGDPADEIVSFADNRSADLIVVGSRGYGPLAGALLGSVSSSVVQHASVPVLVAKSASRRQRNVA